MEHEPCAQYLTLKTEWPKVLAAVESTYLPFLSSVRTDAHGHNAAGLLLFLLRRAETHAVQVHGVGRASRPGCDHLFAAEVRYQFRKGRVFGKPVHALGTCCYNLVHERGERFAGLAGPPRQMSRPQPARVSDDAIPIGSILRSVQAATSAG